MKAKSFLSKTLNNVTPSVHKIRRLSLCAAIESAAIKSAINEGTLSVTGLGRNLDKHAKENHAKEKHRKKRVDRLCNNINIHREIN
jgi:hypothetical protein